MLKFLKILPVVLLFAFAVAKGQPSVLKSGDWYKIGVLQSGIYKLDRGAFEAMGINTSTIDPRKIQLYGNGGGGMLPQANGTPRPLGLQQNAIMVVGEEDGTFNANDVVLFFGNGPDKFDLGQALGSFSYQKNLYADTTYYFLTIGESNGARIASLPTINPNGNIIEQFTEYRVHERDLIIANVNKSGREWVGESFNLGSDRSRVFEFATPGRLAGSVFVTARIFGRPPQGSSFTFNLNSTNLGEIKIDPFLDEFYGEKGVFSNRMFPELNVAAGNSLSVGITYTSGNSILASNLDYLVLTYRRRLEMGQVPLFFNDPERVARTKTFEVASAPNELVVWDISLSTQPKSVPVSLNAGKARITVTDQGTNKYVAFVPSMAIAPVSSRKIPNQDLFSIGPVDAIIVCAPEFLAEANRLAAFREQHDGLVMAVATTAQVYNDFSSGMQDISAIRDFARYHYQQSGRKLKYLLLFGDASYDYKKRISPDHNFVPIYQSRNSTHAIFSHSSDDYFGFLDDHEGEWEERDGGDHILDIGVGRLVVKTPIEAANVVNKLIRYSTSVNKLGDWRKKIYFLADDGDFNIHLRHAEQLAQYMDTTYSEYNLGKIYIDAYPQVSEGGGAKRVPLATRELEKVFEEGAFIVNYTGHGSEGQWATEALLTSGMIPTFKNRVRLPLVVTATCEFGSYDNPDILSGGEQMLLNPEGGAIGLLTTTRPVFAHTNFPVNEAFYRNAFKQIEGRQPRLGDIIKATKNGSLRGPVNRNFALLGDPTMTLAYATNSLQLVNENGGNFVKETVMALGKYSLKGEVRNINGQLLPDYNGNAYIEVTDKPVAKSTLGDESTPTTYLLRESVLFRGEASVRGGKFGFEFVVPKNISYVPDRGKVSMYAIPESGFNDGNGAEINLIVGGSAANIPVDNIPPMVLGYINTDRFLNGQTVGNYPLLLLRIEDESGVSLTTTGIGQQMTATLDDEMPVVISKFYTADRDTYKAGWVRYPLGNLEKGLHTISINVWDTHNNLTTTTVEFYVGDNEGIVINNLMNYPNPMSTTTTFSFSHNRAGEGIKVELTILALNGQKVMQRTYLIDEADAAIDYLTWDGRNDAGAPVNNGIYIYKINVQSTSDGVKREAFEKLIIVN